MARWHLGVEDQSPSSFAFRSPTRVLAEMKLCVWRGGGDLMCTTLLLCIRHPPLLYRPRSVLFAIPIQSKDWRAGHLSRIGSTGSPEDLTPGVPEVAFGLLVSYHLLCHRQVSRRLKFTVCVVFIVLLKTRGILGPCRTAWQNSSARATTLYSICQRRTKRVYSSSHTGRVSSCGILPCGMTSCGTDVL